MITKNIRILLADDHTVMRSGLRLLLERQPNLQVVAEAARRTAGWSTLRSPKKPDVVVMDIAMQHLNGVEAARQIAMRCPATAIVILSMHSDEKLRDQIIESGCGARICSRIRQRRI